MNVWFINLNNIKAVTCKVTGSWPVTLLKKLHHTYFSENFVHFPEKSLSELHISATTFLNTFLNTD